ncbi:uncharacterized protein [Argopecten irradians]|uniref:uncharacterized protein n=1 Tax=Argopecten irradians TaxID=31199 RepID=UPI003715E8DA
MEKPRDLISFSENNSEDEDNTGELSDDDDTFCNDSIRYAIGNTFNESQHKCTSEINGIRKQTISNDLDSFFSDDIFRSDFNPKNIQPRLIDYSLELDTPPVDDLDESQIRTQNTASEESRFQLGQSLSPKSGPMCSNMLEKRGALNSCFRQDSIFRVDSEDGNITKTDFDRPQLDEIVHGQSSSTAIYDRTNEVDTTDYSQLNSNDRDDDVSHIDILNLEAPVESETRGVALHTDESWYALNNAETEFEEITDINSLKDVEFEQIDNHQDPEYLQHLYRMKLRELEIEVNQLEELVAHSRLSEHQTEPINSNHRKLKTQRSVSESDIYQLVECENWKSGEDLSKIPKSPSADDVPNRFRLKEIADKLITRKQPSDLTQTENALTMLDIRVDSQVKLTCPCKVCRRVGRIAAAPGDFLYVAFTPCSWIALYDHRKEQVMKLDTRCGPVDSLAVSEAGTLYISCPQRRKILRLSTNMELTEFCVFKTLYPRGLAVSPEDDSLVVCMAPYPEGTKMDAPSPESCLMRFSGQAATVNEPGTIVNMDAYFGYPMKVVINKNGYILVSDFGLKCLFILNDIGHMMRTVSMLEGERLPNVYTLACSPSVSFFIVSGKDKNLSITQLGEDTPGNFEEKLTSRKSEKTIGRNIIASTMVNDRKIVAATGNMLVYISLKF